MPPPKTPPISTRPQTFKDTLYRDAETGWLTIFYAPSRQTVWFPVTKPMPKLDLGQNCYLGLGIRRSRPSNNRGRGKIDDIIGIPGLWLDLDYESPGAHKARHPLPQDEAAALSLLDAAPYKPSLIVHSGHGLQVYWLFKELACFDTKDEREAFGRLCRGWQHLFQQAGRDRGWHVDSTADLTRILRIPGTLNLKTEEAREVLVQEANGLRYDPSDFSDFAKPEGPPSPKCSLAASSSGGNLDLRSLRVSPRIKYLIQHGDTIGQYPSRSEALFAVLMALLGAGYEDPGIATLCMSEGHDISELPREKGPAWLAQELKRARRKATSLTQRARGEPEDGHDLLIDQRRPSKVVIDGLLNEGMILFGGKPKRGKSWLMLDLALSVGTGSQVWRHFPVREPQPVLYIGLEDGRDEIRERLLAIQPGLTNTGKLQFLYNFPRLNEGGLGKLRGFAESGRYRLIIIDVLARIESTDRRASDKSYHDIYEMLTPLQDMRHEHPLCLILVTHLRKAEAQDIFDGLHGSVAYQGVQDSLWVLERPLANSVGVVHTLGKASYQQALHVSFVDGHWEFLGYDADMKLSQARQDIIELLEEKERILTVDEILKGLSRPREHYQNTKRTLSRMVQDDQIVRFQRGRYGLACQRISENSMGKNGTGDSWGLC